MEHPAVTILEDIIAISSVNPGLESTARGEGDVADYLEERCRKAGLHVSRSAGQRHLAVGWADCPLASDLQIASMA